MILEKFDIVHVMNRKGNDSVRIDYFFVAKKYNGFIKNNEPNKCSELKWFKMDNLPTNTIEYIKDAINYIKHDQMFSEYGWLEQGEEK